MVDYWTSFARSGVPRGKPANGATNWPRYAEAKDNVKYLDLAGSKVTGGYGGLNDCALWDGILSYK
jgi:carboxylesterase type B